MIKGFIKLTQTDNKPVVVRINAITKFKPENLATGGTHTRICFEKEHGVSVKESLEEVAKRIGEASIY